MDNFIDISGRLSRVIDIEVRFDIAVNAYIELHTESFKQLFCWRRGGEFDFIAINEKLWTFLSASRSVTEKLRPGSEQLKDKALVKISGTSPRKLKHCKIASDVEKFLSKRFDSDEKYRTMELARNAINHHNMLIREVKVRVCKEYVDPTILISTKSLLSALLSAKEEGNVREKHAEFLRKEGCEIDLIEYSARYLSSILEAMELFREHVEHIASSSLSEVDVFESELDRALKNSRCETEHQKVSFSQQRERVLIDQIRSQSKRIEALQIKNSISPSLADRKSVV